MPGSNLAARGGTTPARPTLDPDKNISTRAPGPCACDIAGENAELLPGHWRRQYLAAAQREDWGVEGATCGGACLLRQRDDLVELIPRLCGRWACPLCGPMRAAWLKRQIRAAQVASKLDYFWTLTCRTSTIDAPGSFAKVKGAWNIVRTDLHKAHGPFEYVWTVEATRRGYAHLHLLCSLDISHGELSRRWLAATDGSWVVDVRPVSSQRASDYLSKYCTQQARLRAEPGWEALAGSRAFSKSRRVVFEPFRGTSEADGWRPWNRPYWDTARRLRAAAPVVRERITGTPGLAVRDHLIGGVPTCLQHG